VKLTARARRSLQGNDSAAWERFCRMITQRTVKELIEAGMLEQPKDELEEGGK
jgi:hypothetical protein